MMNTVTDYTSLVAAAAHAAGPCPKGGEADWQRRVHELAVELAFTAREVAQDMQTLDGARSFSALLDKVEIEETTGRGLLTLIPPSGTPETIRTEHQHTVRGGAMINRARELTGRWVQVYRHNEPKASGGVHNVRMVVRLLDLGEGRMPNELARQVLIHDAGGDEALARRAWNEAGLPLTGSIAVADLEPVRQQVRHRSA
jgi:hypothetical protein